MKTYLITYDLIMPETAPHYVALINRIKAYGLWAKPLESVWLIKTNQTLSEVMANLKIALNFNDKILIMEVSNSWIALNLPERVVFWMKQGL